MKKTILLSLLVAVLVAATSRMARRLDRLDVASSPGRPEAQAKQPTSETRHPFVGVIVASRSADLASRIDGLVAHLSAHLGQHIVRGEALAVLANPTLVEDLRIAKERVSLTADQLRRAKQMFASQAIAAVEMTQSEATAKLASLELDKARAAVGELTVRAPFDGVIAAVYIEDGAHVQAGQPIVRVLGSGPVRVRLAVPESDAAQVVVGTRLVASVEHEPTPFVVEIDAVSSEVEPASRTVVAEAQLKHPAGHNPLVGRLVRLVLPREAVLETAVDERRN